MRSKFIIIGVVVLGFVAVSFAFARPDDGGRYFVASHNGILKAVGGVRHNFDNGFTTEPTEGQRVALEVLSSFLDVSVEPVPLYYVTDFEIERVNGKPGGGGKPDGGTSRVYMPSDQTPWGIQMVYNDPVVSATSGGVGVDVAVLDTGVYKKHFDLVNRVKQCKDFTPSPSIKVGSCDDRNGHGTHVAGTILADAGVDKKGIYGVAPEANLWAYKVCGNDGSCWADDIAFAIRHAVDQGAEVVSMSLGGDVASALINSAVDYAVAGGVLVVAAAGNDGPADGSIDWPGAYVKVVAVGALDSVKNVPTWSSRGINPGVQAYVVEDREVEFGAPGVSVESTWRDGGYRLLSGTSMATPHVSGLAAKVWQGSAGATRDYLHTLAKDIWTVGDDSATGFGLPTL